MNPRKSKRRPLRDSVIGMLIARRSYELNMSTYAMAKAGKIPYNLFWFWEFSERPVPPGRVKDLAKALKLPIGKVARACAETEIRKVLKHYKFNDAADPDVYSVKINRYRRKE